MAKALLMPPNPLKEDGRERRVGVEMEMSGIELSMIACQINIAFGGRIEEISPFEFVIGGTDLGDFKIELDFVYLKNYAREKYRALQTANDSRESQEPKAHPPGRRPVSSGPKTPLAGAQLDEVLLSELADMELPDLETMASEALSLVAKNVVPLEIVTPPIPLSELHWLDTLVRRLRDHEAKGTRHLLFYAFGVHLNPELPNLDVATILRYFRAFLCLHDWLAEEEKVAFSRRVTPFINRFPSDYTRKVVSPHYCPTQAEFIDDYLDANPSRNRALDLLPLLTWLDEPRVRALLPEEKIGKRPTFHYRLPNSDVDNPDWSIAQPWNNWVMVERLANQPKLLNEMMWALSRHLELFSIELVSWKERLKSCVRHLS